MKSLISKIFVAIGLLAVTGCTKQKISPNQPPAAPPVDIPTLDVYVGGATSNTATWWKNGVSHKVKDSVSPSRATCMAVSGNDVYLAGSIVILNTQFNYPHATYWKNGVVKTSLPVKSYATAIAISDGAVLVLTAVHYNGHVMIPICWQADPNGVWVSTGRWLIDGAPGNTGSGMIINGTDSYAIGTSGAVACFWKHDKITLLTASTSPSFANAIAVSDSNVYIAGTAGPAASSTPLYWKNGTAYPLAPPADSTQVSGIAVNGSDVYVSGTVLASASGQTTVAVYWKNGVETKLTCGSASTAAHAIAVNGPDVYVVGTANDGTGTVPIIWKNGVATKLADNGEATCLVLVPNNL